MKIFSLLLVCIALIPGCKQKKQVVKTPEFVDPTTNPAFNESEVDRAIRSDLRRLNLAVIEYLGDTNSNTLPPNADALKKYLLSESFAKLKSGRYVINWNAPAKNPGIIVMEKDADINGGFALPEDGDERKMTSDEIKKLMRK